MSRKKETKFEDCVDCKHVNTGRGCRACGCGENFEAKSGVRELGENLLWGGEFSDE